MIPNAELVADAAEPRFPVRERTDGDFRLSELLAAAPPDSAAYAAVSHGHRTRPVSQAEVQLLHSIETSATLRLPVADNCSALTAEQGESWLALAAQWITVASRTGDLRFFNATCKLLGAVNVSPARGSSRVSEQLSQVSHLISEMTAKVCDRLERQFASCHAPDGHAADETARWTGKSTRRPQRIVVLAGEGSGTAAGLAAMADAAEVPLAGLCWFMPPNVIVPDSSYAQAWYPADGVSDSPAPAISSRVAQARADSWGQVMLVLRDLHPDLILLAGMPIVPAEVLGLARLGVLNAHNGALPGYRGMDAVAWAILCNDPITCTLHVADRRPDHGPVLAAAPVAFEPAGTLRVRVKEAQLSLLTSAARHVSNTGELRPMRQQLHGQGRQFYRLHPHLKRILDGSPYGIARTKETGGLA